MARITSAAAITNKLLKTNSRFRPRSRPGKHSYGKRRINGKSAVEPPFNRPLTIRPAKSATIRPAKSAQHNRACGHGAHRLSDPFNAARTHAMAPRAPARARQKRRQFRHAELLRPRSGAIPIFRTSCGSPRWRSSAPTPVTSSRLTAAVPHSSTTRADASRSAPRQFGDP